MTRLLGLMCVLLAAGCGGQTLDSPTAATAVGAPAPAVVASSPGAAGPGVVAPGPPHEPAPLPNGATWIRFSLADAPVGGAITRWEVLRDGRLARGVTFENLTLSCDCDEPDKTADAQFGFVFDPTTRRGTVRGRLEMGGRQWTFTGNLVLREDDILALRAGGERMRLITVFEFKSNPSEISVVEMQIAVGPGIFR